MEASNQKQVILITGSSTGFGKLTAKLFHKNGWNVIATMRSPEKETELTEFDNMFVTRLDVTDPASIHQAIEEGVIEGPRLLISIIMMSQTGGHGDYWMPAGFRVPKRTWLPEPVADGVDEVRRKVRHTLMAGADRAARS